MTPTVGDILSLMEALAPSELAEKWDNSGLQIGKRDWPVKKVMIALDACPEVLNEAINRKADLLITHHPLLFSPLTSIDLDQPVGAMVGKALNNRLAVYAAHTNLDSVSNGLNDILAHRLGLTDICILLPGRETGGGGPASVLHGLGRIGMLPENMTLKALAFQIKEALSLDHLELVGMPDMVVRKVAVCTGSGSSLLKAFFASGAQVYISGDLRYHDAKETQLHELGLIDIGHFASEHLMVNALAARLKEIFDTRGFEASVHACSVEKDPFVGL